MDEITQVKIRYRMEQWMQLIKECQASGMSVRSWCRQNDIKEAAYYYWLKRIRQDACAQYLPAVQPENQKPVEFAKLRVDTEIAKTSASATVTIHLASATVEVKEGTSQKTLEAVLLALKALC